MSIQLYAAPMQGHTDAPWRNIHAAVYGAADAYFTPFIRYDRGEIRVKDAREITSSLNDGIRVVPQIIFSGEEEFVALCDWLEARGLREIDLNIGCPYPMQTNRGRGSHLLSEPEKLQRIMELVKARPEVRFSVKMRAGFSAPDEWERLIGMLNEAPLGHIVFHPRVASQKYGGELLMDQFGRFLESSAHPVIFNGDILSPEEINALAGRYPGLSGIMVGRGLLGRPSLIAEAREGEWPDEKRLERMLCFHDSLRAYFEPKLCGEAQLLARLKAFWEYAEPEIGRKAWKQIHKAVSMAKYEAAFSRL